MCSKQTDAAEASKVFSTYGNLDGQAVEIPEGYQHPLFDFSAIDRVPDLGIENASDLSLKRNIGLVVGRAIGDRLLFMDDDIDVKPHSLDKAGHLLSRYAIAGFQCLDYPDNSVVNHAVRLVKKDSGTGTSNFSNEIFISASCMAVNPRRVNSHFPSVYNEDWLFMFDAVAGRRAVHAGESRQAVFDPFATPNRATSEEFGENIAEGLYGYLKLATDTDLLQYIPDHDMLQDAAYWTGVLDYRQDRIKRLSERVPDTAPQVLASLDAALEASRNIRADDCIAYIKAWRADQDAWIDRLADLPDFRSIDDALNYLELA